MTTYTLLDTRGLMLRAHHSGKHNGATTANGKSLRQWKDGLANFVEQEISPLLEGGIAPQNIIAAWDGGNDYRTNLYPDYKKARREKEQDPEITEEISTLKKKTISLLANLGIKSVYVPGEEADDLVALLCERVEADGFVVKTNDNDLLQLVSDKVSVWVSKEFHQPGTKYKGTIPLTCVKIYKALVGDSSDGYSGVPGLGNKYFSMLLKDYGEDGLLQIQDAIERNDWNPVQAAFEATKDQTLSRILEHWSDATLCLKLAALAPQTCYGSYRNKRAKRPVWTARIPNRDKVLEAFKEIGIAPGISKYDHLFPQHLLAKVSNHEQLVSLGEQIVNSPVVSWDYESTDKLKHKPFQEAKKKGGGTYVDVLSQEVAGVSVNFGPFMEQTVYLPVDHKDTENFPTDWLAWLLGVVNSRTDRSVVQNAAFEMTVTRTNLLPAMNAPYDTAIMSSYVDENEESNLKGMSLRYLGYQQATYEETTQGRDMCNLTGEEVLSYGCDDSLVTSHLFQLFRLIMQLEGSWQFYVENEVEPVEEDVLDFIDGQEIDYVELGKQAEESREVIETSTERLRELLRENVNLATQAEVQGRALTLFNEWYLTEKFKANGDPEKDTEIRQKLWEKAWRSCFYEDYQEQVEIPAFTSTPTMLNKVIEQLCPGAPKIEKANGPGVEDYETRWSEFHERTPIDDDAFEGMDKFVALLFSARRKLGPASRSGPAYDALAAFCSGVLNGAQVGKTVKTGCELSVNSGPQMQGLLYGQMGLPIRRRSKVTRGSLRDSHGLHGSPAVGLKAIAAAFVYDLPEEGDWRIEALKKYRDVALETQNQSLYYTSYPLWKHPRDGNIHPQVRNCGTVTRRPAGNDPNVLQVSKKDGAKLRKVYKAGDYGDGERVVVSADFANQELVITAAESQDPVMLDAFMQTPRRDLHSLTSCGYAHILVPRISPDLVGTPYGGGQLFTYEAFMSARRGGMGEGLQAASNTIRNKYSKAVNFLIAYLGGYTTLAGNLLIPQDLAKQLMQSTFDLYARLAPWQQEVIEFARVHGYSQTAYGNRRHATADLWSADDFLRTRQERQVVNAVVQGGAADILKVVRQEMHRRKMRQNYAMRAVKPVYDEVTASIPVAAIPDYCEELVEVMSVTPPGYPVGMKVDLSIGKTWGDQVELEGTSRAIVEQTMLELTQQ